MTDNPRRWPGHRGAALLAHLVIDSGDNTAAPAYSLPISLP